MITQLVRRALPLLALAALLGIVIRIQTKPVASADAWFHLRFGHEFLSGWNVREPGHLGVFDTASWTPTQWLGQEAMAAIASNHGIGGVIWATGAFVMLLSILVYQGCRVVSSPLPAVIATWLATVAALPGLVARPQLLSYLFVVLTMTAWLRTARGKRTPYWLLAVAWLWPMFHGMWPVGITISAAAVLGLSLRDKLSASATARLALVPLLSCLVAVLNPMGLDVVRALVMVGERATYFTEWGPTNFRSAPGLVLSALLLIVLISAMRAPSTDWFSVCLIVLATAWGLYSLRTAPVAALMVAPLASAAMERVMPGPVRMTRGERLALVGMFVAGSIAMVPVATQQASERVVPRWVDEELAAMPTGTRILNDWDTGSYFLFRHQRLDYVMHGYGDVFTDQELARNVGLIRLEPGWIEDVVAADPELALLDSASPLRYALQTALDWSVVQEDRRFVILEPPVRAAAEG